MIHKSLPSRSRSRSSRRGASLNLTQFIKKLYPNKIPISTITGISKLYCRKNATTKQSKIIKRIAESTTHVNTAKFIQLISSQTQYKKAITLNEETIKKTYQGACNPEGKLSFDYLMKMGERTGVNISQKMAKGIIKKYGKRKDFMNLDDCQRLVKRRNENLNRRLSPRQSPRASNAKKI